MSKLALADTLRSHKDMAYDLARFLQEGSDWMTWTNHPLGSVLFDSPGLADVLAIRKSYSHMTIRIYEIKLSRSDFLGDVSRRKYRRYMDSCHQVYFAVKTGLILKAEVPEGCGLITRSDTNWRVAKTAPMRECQPGINFLQSLLLKGYENHWTEYRELDVERFKEYTGLREFAFRYGRKVAEDIARGQEIIQEAEKIRANLSEVLGIKVDSAYGGLLALKAAVNKLLGQHKYAEDAAMVAYTAMELFNNGGTDHTRRSAVKVLRGLADKLEDKKEDAQNAD